MVRILVRALSSWLCSYIAFPSCMHKEANSLMSLLKKALILLWASQVAQWVKNLPAKQETQETQVRSLGQEDPLEKGMATHSSILAWRILWLEEPWVTDHRVAKSQTRLKQLTTDTHKQSHHESSTFMT